MLTVLDVIRRTTEFFREKGVDNPRLDAEWIAAHVLGLNRMELYLQFERPLGTEELNEIRSLIRRRGRREPLQYVLGHTDFFDLKLKVDCRALIPRPETEELVDQLVRRLGSSPPRTILDLGTGSGAIALALAASFPDAAAVAVDHSAEALSLAAENAVFLNLEDRVTFICSHWFDALRGKEGSFDLIVANPPYLSSREWGEAERELRDFEPEGAFVAEREGLEDLEGIIGEAAAFLSTKGMLALETGIEHHASLVGSAKNAGLTLLESVKDFSGRDRYLFFEREG